LGKRLLPGAIDVGEPLLSEFQWRFPATERGPGPGHGRSGSKRGIPEVVSRTEIKAQWQVALILRRWSSGWVEVFEPGTAGAQHRFQVHASRVVQRNGRQPIARFSADGWYLACCRGGTACLWDVSDGSHIGDYKTLKHRQFLGRVHRVLQAAAPASDGSRILLGAGGKGGGWFRMPAAAAHRSVLTSLFEMNFQPMGTKWRELGEPSVWRTKSDDVEGVLSSNDKDEFDAVMDVAFVQDDTHVASLTHLYAQPTQCRSERPVCRHPAISEHAQTLSHAVEDRSPHSLLSRSLLSCRASRSPTTSPARRCRSSAICGSTTVDEGK
jgi:hypothetical protein